MENTDTQQVRAHFAQMDAGTQSMIAPYLTEPSLDTWVRDVLLTYGQYFLRVLQKNVPTDEAATQLRDDLRPLVVTSPASETNMDDIEAALAVQFRERGLYFLGGQTLPYYGPYIWNRMESQAFKVEIPEGIQEVTVHFLHGFLMRSWYHFNSLGQSGAAGWAKWGDADRPDGLYCVYDAWGLAQGMDGLAFQVSLLKHEAQHLSDLQKHPGIASVDLEYRAKLVELIYLTSLEQRFLPFLREAEDDPTNPHSQAAYRIVKDLSQSLFAEEYVTDEARWQQVEYRAVQDSARQLLAEMSVAPTGVAMSIR